MIISYVSIHTSAVGMQTARIAYLDVIDLDLRGDGRGQLQGTMSMIVGSQRAITDHEIAILPLDLRPD
jgi:hypothetical protein